MTKWRINYTGIRGQYRFVRASAFQIHDGFVIFKDASDKVVIAINKSEISEIVASD